MQVQEQVMLKPYTTFRLGGPASFFAELTSPREVGEYATFAASKNLPLFVLGGGSNIILPDHELRACVGHISIEGFEVLSETATHADIQIGAGEEWDSVVVRSIERGFSGIEALSMIPGSAGATPIQNVGAYGQEISDVLLELEAYDLSTRSVVRMSALECMFSYRDSIFRREGAGKHVILSITLRLSKEKPTSSAHADIKNYFEESGIRSPTLLQIRNRVVEVRKRKLPDPKDVASCGSFFKNPIVSAKKAQEIRERYPRTIMFSDPSGNVKLGAGSMLDILGFKGKEFGAIAVYPHNALVLTNKGNATRQEVEKTAAYLTEEVEKAFGVRLEPEPIFL